MAHGFAQFLVLDELARAFHGGEEGGFVVAGGWFGLEFLDLDGLGRGRFPFFDGDERVVFLAGGEFAVDFEPAGFAEDFPVGFEFFTFDGGDAFGHLKFGGRVEDGDEASRHEVVELHFVFVEFVGAGAGRDDGVVVADFGVVEDARGRFDPVVGQGLAGVGGEGFVEAGQDLFGDGEVVGRQVA